MNAIRDVVHPNGEWRGNKSKEQLVKEYIKNHPGENPTQIAKALNVSRPTVYKYMK
jgi:DNA-binding MarR family transcriptional regulator